MVLTDRQVEVLRAVFITIGDLGEQADDIAAEAAAKLHHLGDEEDVSDEQMKEVFDVIGLFIEPR